ncbi:MAG: prepilin-type N-terminal cleavage/methylation domain-containing protein [bacterium]|nr:prepilin-type N-terminal cleavage/methylation domain-containing protein [bacterium]
MSNDMLRGTIRIHQRTQILTAWFRAGFTLIEMMAAVCIFGIVIAIGLPQLLQSMDTVNSRQCADAISGRLRLARSQSVTNNSDVVVYFNRNGVGTYTVHVDNGGGTGNPSDPAFTATNRNNGQVDANESVYQTINLEERVVFGYIPGGMNSTGEFLDASLSFQGVPKRVIFHPDGTASEDGWISVMPVEDFLEQQIGREFLVEVTSSTGEIRVLSTTH